eukprot:GHVU01159919.1.p1 GENE.GHVU01159919.1~~GHVU01159919.1.p1  ORF type:complete len:252 (-),score=32.81 GHVU01159919.1:252-1007(-)
MYAYIRAHRGVCMLVCAAATGLHPFVQKVDPGPMKNKNDYTPREVMDLWKEVHSRFKVVYGNFDVSGNMDQCEESFVKFIKPSEKGVFLLYQWTLEIPDCLDFARAALPLGSQFDTLGGNGVGDSGNQLASVSPQSGGIVAAAVESLAAGQQTIIQLQQLQQQSQHVREVQAMHDQTLSTVTGLQLQRHQLVAVGADCGLLDSHLATAKTRLISLQAELDASLPFLLYNSSAQVPPPVQVESGEETAASAQ